MTYTITINDKSEKAQSIIKMLKELSRDYSFLKVYENDSVLSEKLEKELDKRLDYVIRNPEVGKTWEEVKSTLIL